MFHNQVRKILSHQLVIVYIAITFLRLQGAIVTEHEVEKNPRKRFNWQCVLLFSFPKLCVHACIVNLRVLQSELLAGGGSLPGVQCG